LPALGWLLILLLALSVVAAAGPELYREARGWSSNSEVQPTVVGPGDEITVFFPDKVSSVYTYWNGNCSVIATSPSDPTFRLQLPALTKNSTWGPSISVTTRGSPEGTEALWVKVKLPDDPQLVGKPLQLTLRATINYPRYHWELMTGERFSEVKSEPHSLTVPLKLSPPGASEEYNRLWNLGLWGAYAASALFGLMLPIVGNGIRRRALPTDVFVPSPTGAY
jgi:hypothetical protein